MMRRIMTWLVALMFLAPVCGLAQNNQANIDAEINAQLPSTGQQFITAARLRQVLHDMNAAVFQGAVGSVQFSGTPSAGYIPIATSPTTAAWGNLFTNNQSVTPANTPCNRGSAATIFCNTLGTAISVSRAPSGTSVGSAGNPATGYVFNQNLTAISAYVNNTSGNNQGTADNTGRTGALQFYSKTDQNGQGDLTSYFCDGFVASTRPGATQFLASPQIGCIGGQLLAAANGAYLQGIGDINFKDVGFDIAAVGLNFNFNRANAIGALNANWGAFTFQNQGTVPIDWMVRATGAVRVGSDYSGLTFPDNTLIGVTLSSGGSGCSANDVLTASGGTFDQQTVLKVLTVDGSGVVLTFAVDRGGLYSVSPASTNTVTGGTCSVAPVFILQYTTPTQMPAMATKANECWYGNATQDTGVYNTSFSSTLKLGTSYICFSSSLVAWNFITGNNSVLQLYNNRVLANQTLVAFTNLQVGQATALSMTSGEVGFAKIAASGSAPGAAGAKEAWVCGTNAGSVKKIAYAGTSATPVTIVDNVGSGVTGC
jgi:hypothetical protein